MVKSIFARLSKVSLAPVVMVGGTVASEITLVKALPAKALSPILVTLSGRITVVNRLFLNALVPIV